MRTSTLISSWPAKVSWNSEDTSRSPLCVGSIAALNKFTVSLSVIVPHIKSFYWNARTISELLYIEEPVNWRLTVFFRKCPLLSLGASRSKLMSWIATSMMLIRRPMFSVTRSGIRPPILASLSSGLIIADNAAIAPETSVNGSNKAMKVTGSVKVGGVPPPKPLSCSNGPPTLFQYQPAQNH